MFFQLDQTKRIINQFLIRLEHFEPTVEEEKVVKSYLKLVARYILEEGEDWDKSCEVNIGWIGKSFLEDIERFANSGDESILKELFIYLFRFAVEYDLSHSDVGQPDLKRFITYGYDKLPTFPGDVQAQIIYALQQMPINLFKRLLRSQEAQDIAALKSMLASAEERHQVWIKEFADKETKIAELQKALDTVQSKSNFVGLYRGFERLRRDKYLEKSVAGLSLFGLAILSFVPLLFGMYRLSEGATSLELRDMVLAVFTLSAFALVAYYFRVILQSFRSLQSQILQIELRMALCQFIQSYAKYANEMTKDNKDLLTRFESVIFSNIVPDGSQIPAVHDGVADLARALSEFKKSKE